MKAAELIGSLLYFKNEVSLDQLKKINLNIDHEIYDLTYNYNDVFKHSYNVFSLTDWYQENKHILKQRFFDKLSNENKKLIYRYINLLVELK